MKRACVCACVWLQWLGWICMQRKGYCWGLGARFIRAPVWGDPRSPSLRSVWVGRSEGSPQPAEEPELRAHSAAQRRRLPGAPAAARRGSGRSVQQQPDFKDSYLYHATRCAILSSLRARCALVAPPEAVHRSASATQRTVAQIPKPMHPFRVIDDDTNVTF